jgi:hypothetical protein
MNPLRTSALLLVDVLAETEQERKQLRESLLAIANLPTYAISIEGSQQRLTMFPNLPTSLVAHRRAIAPLSYGRNPNHSQPLAKSKLKGGPS